MNSSVTPLVSVVVIVYNHERYLARALQSIEEQVLDGVIEIVIHDDCSTDNSATIAREFASRSRHAVKLICQPVNLIGNGKGIWRDIHDVCTGEYVAICEGDDFWTHPQKLAAQCQAMSVLPQVDLVFHKTARIQFQSEAITGYVGDFGDVPKLFSVNEVIEGDGGFVPTPSIVFRRALVQSLPGWYFDHLPVGDYALQVHAALRGGALYLPLCGAAYREGDPTSWSQQTWANIHTVNRFDQAFILSLFVLRASLPEGCFASVDKLMLNRFLVFCQRCFLHHQMADIAPLAAAIERGRDQRS